MTTDKLKSIFLVSVLLIAGFIVILPFINGLAWAIILVVATWPIYLWVRRRIGSQTFSSLVMCLLVVTVLVAAVVPMTIRLSQEAQVWVGDQSPAAIQSQVTKVTESIRRVPVVGEQAFQWSNHMISSGEGIKGLISSHEGQIMTTVSSAARGLLGAATTLASMLVFAFFMYRDGEMMGRRTTKALSNIFGKYGAACCSTTVNTVRGTVLGVVVTAIVQGLLATFGYFVAGAPFPVLLGFATLVLAFVPFGAPLVYVPVAGFLVAQGNGWGWGLALLAWGVGVVSTSDNFLRPVFISRATNISMLYVVLGVLGGIITMGMLGLFIGPVIIALAADIFPKLLIGEDEVEEAAREPATNCQS